MDHCAARQAGVKQQQWVERREGGSGGWWVQQEEKSGGQEREKGSDASQNPPLPRTPPLRFTAEVDADSFTKWLSHDLQAQTVCCALGRPSSEPENRSFVWRSTADTPESPPCYGRERARERHTERKTRVHPGKRLCVKNEASVSEGFSLQLKTLSGKFGATTWGFTIQCQQLRDKMTRFPVNCPIWQLFVFRIKSLPWLVIDQF